MSTHTEWINNLLDGDLEAMHESSLFGELAVNSDLRAELKQQLAIRSAVQNDRVGLVPPIALTNTLFSGMGFAAPLAGAAAGAAGGGLLIQWLTRMGLPLLTSIAAAGISYGVYSSADNSNKPATVVLQNNTSVAGNATPEPRVTSASDQTLINNLRKENTTLRASLRATLRAQETSQPEEITSVVESRQEPTVDRIELTNSQNLTYSNEPRMLQATAITPINIRTVQYPSFLVQLRGISGTSVTNVNVPVQTSWYDNMSIGLLYQLSDRNAVGLEFGTESYAMSFEGQQNGQTIQYEQQPLSAWAGVTYRHTLPTIGKTAFAPFGQALLGGTKFGPLGRLTAGVTYAPSGPLSFIFGLEGSTMAYQFQNSWYATSKIGFTYGLAVRF